MAPALFLPYLEMHGVRMNDHACDGGESREERDNMNRFSHHILHGRRETLLKFEHIRFQSGFKCVSRDRNRK